jgi:hypothetical protein
MENTKYGELVPDGIVDIFYQRIYQCIHEKDTIDTVENWTKRMMRINGKIPNKIKNLIRTNNIKQLLNCD